jgi:transcriptional regulator with XRE-family HTH domain
MDDFHPDRLKRRREAMNITRAEVARRTGMSAGGYGLIETGRLVPYPSQILKLQRALGPMESWPTGDERP